MIFFIAMVSIVLVSCSKKSAPKLSAENSILSFKIKYDTIISQGVIDNTTKTITLKTHGLELHDSLVPYIQISPDASITPDSAIAQNFNNTVIYTVTAQNGNKATYSIKAGNTPVSDEKKILSFQFNINGQNFVGAIDQTSHIIYFNSYEDITQVAPDIKISDYATISPPSGQVQNFTEDVKYTVTAEDGTKNTYSVVGRWYMIPTVNCDSNTSDFVTKYFRNAKPYVMTRFVDMTVPDSKIVLENDKNSYDLHWFNYSSTGDTNSNLVTQFQIEFPDNIVSASDYKLIYKVGDKIEAVSTQNIDVLNQALPVIDSVNKSSYQYGDTLIIKGKHLIHGINIPIGYSGDYNFSEYFSTLNSDSTVLTVPLNLYRDIFNMPGPVSIFLFADGRFGDEITVNFK